MLSGFVGVVALDTWVAVMTCLDGSERRLRGRRDGERTGQDA